MKIKLQSDAEVVAPFCTEIVHACFWLTFQCDQQQVGSIVNPEIKLVSGFNPIRNLVHRFDSQASRLNLSRTINAAESPPLFFSDPCSHAHFKSVYLDQLPSHRKLLNAVVIGIHHIQVSLAVERHPVGGVEFSCSRSLFIAAAAEILSG